MLHKQDSQATATQLHWPCAHAVCSWALAGMLQTRDGPCGTPAAWVVRHDRSQACVRCLTFARVCRWWITVMHAVLCTVTSRYTPAAAVKALALSFTVLAT